MWESSKGDTKFTYAMNLVPLNFVGSIVHLNIIK
jgi:hypothetical protein